MEIADELAYESVAAASATVAAYFRYLGTIADWLSGHGIPTAAARRYVADTFAALSGELDSPDPDFAALAQATPRPEGSTSSSRATLTPREPTTLCRSASTHSLQGSLTTSNRCPEQPQPFPSSHTPHTPKRARGSALLRSA